MTRLPRLWLVSHEGRCLALVAADNRDTACRIAHGLNQRLPYYDLSTLHVGTAKTAEVGMVADLRAKVDGEGDIVESFQRRHRAGHKPGPNAPTPALVAFSALCAAFGIAEDVARTAQTPAATRLRWAIWQACIDAGYNQREAADVTGHNHGTVAAMLVDRRRGRRTAQFEDPQFVAALRFARDAMVKHARSGE